MRFILCLIFLCSTVGIAIHSKSDIIRRESQQKTDNRDTNGDGDGDGDGDGNTDWGQQPVTADGLPQNAMNSGQAAGTFDPAMYGPGTDGSQYAFWAPCTTKSKIMDDFDGRTPWCEQLCVKEPNSIADHAGFGNELCNRTGYVLEKVEFRLATWAHADNDQWPDKGDFNGQARDWSDCDPYHKFKNTLCEDWCANESATVKEFVFNRSGVHRGGCAAVGYPKWIAGESHTTVFVGGYEANWPAPLPDDPGYGDPGDPTADGTVKQTGTGFDENGDPDPAPTWHDPGYGR